MTGAGLARTGSVVLVGSLVGAVANFALAIVIGRGLGPAGTGTFFAVVGAFVVASNVLKLGADTGLVRGLSRHRALSRRDDLGRTILVAALPVVLVGAMAGLAIWANAPWLAGLLGGPADLAERADAFRNLAPFVLAASLLGVLLGGTRGLGGVVPIVLVQSVGLPVTRLIVAWLLLAAGAGVVTVLQWWAVAIPVGAVLAAAILLLMWRATMRDGPSLSTAGPRPTRHTAAEFWGFSLPRGVAAAIEITLEWVDVLVVAVLLSPAHAGVYAIVTRCVRAGQLVEHAARVAVAPLVSAAAAAGELQRMNALYEGVTRALVGLAFPFYLTLTAFAPTVLGLFGSPFSEGATALRIASLGMLLALSAGALQSVILMAGRSSWQVWNKTAALVTCVVLLLVLVPRWGIEGAAAAWVAAIAVDTTRAALQARRLGVRLRSRETLVLGGTALAVFGGAGAGTQLVLDGIPALALHLVVGLACYGVIGWLRRDRLITLRHVLIDGPAHVPDPSLSPGQSTAGVPS